MLDFFIKQKGIDKYGVGLMQGLYEVGDKLYNMHHEFLQGKYDSVEELRKMRDWFGEEYKIGELVAVYLELKSHSKMPYFLKVALQYQPARIVHLKSIFSTLAS
ncbi:hypothetical protein MKX03_010567 [Papaver bracteatum]|nr:hypothetical protein MKX03_010567 [Papaver bracteatum]